jgi:uncharacterized membrane protein YcjF (UPF0283 family)
MKKQSADIPLHDIAPFLEIREYSLYWFIVLITVIFLIALVLVKQIRQKKYKEVNSRRERYENFLRIDIHVPKAAAYAICEQGAFFADDNEQTRDTYQQLYKRLERYKYARHVEALDNETLELYRGYQNRIMV